MQKGSCEKTQSSFFTAPIEKPIQSILIPRIPEGTEIGENHTEEIFTGELEDDYNKELHFNDIR